MERLKWKDIPLKVLESIYKKWVEVKVNLPEGSYWVGCVLCEYCDKKCLTSCFLPGTCKCDICPAVPRNWCAKGHGCHSRLNKSYHWGKPSTSNVEVTQRWKKDITKFLKFLRRHIDNRRKRNS